MQHFVISSQTGRRRASFCSLFLPKKGSILDKEEFSTIQMAIVQFPT